MQDKPSPLPDPTPHDLESDAESTTARDRGSDAEVIGESNAGSGAEVTGVSTDLDLVDEALDALDQDDLERAEELAERLQSPETPGQS